ncbi:hypothetical protein HID58_003706 [Brassica napus]|uniref:Non-specific serine/threonine protein kinase n=1 Tax=Brassica napus TaxID=3708 RepID=A0ABQ8EQU7_BRANA|nr:hypothetical protein HID58_003706 [Brassica napus]
MAFAHYCSIECFLNNGKQLELLQLVIGLPIATILQIRCRFTMVSSHLTVPNKTHKQQYLSLSPQVSLLKDDVELDFSDVFGPLPEEAGDVAFDEPAVIHTRSHSLVGPSSIGSHSFKLSKLTLLETEDSVDLVECVERESSPFSGTDDTDSDGSPEKDVVVKVPGVVGLDDFEVMKVVGKGAFGKVYQVKKKETSEIFAMKVMRKDKIMEKNHAEYMKAERDILTKIDHPFIVQLKYSFQTKYRLYLVLDFINGGHLFFQLYHQGLFRSNSMCGTTEYMAPEIVKGKGHDKAADWWSVGILLYEMLTGKPPFMGSRGKIEQKIVKDKIKLPQFLSSEAHSLLKGLLQKEPERRLGSGPSGAGEIKEHKWFKGMNWKKLEAREVKPSFKPEISGRQCIANFDKCWTEMSVLDSPANSPSSDPKANPFTNFTYCPVACKNVKPLQKHMCLTITPPLKDNVDLDFSDVFGPLPQESSDVVFDEPAVVHTRSHSLVGPSSIVDLDSEKAPEGDVAEVSGEVGIEDFEVLKVVGQGAFGKVFQVRKKDTSEIFAMKVMRKDKIMEKNHAEYMKAERDILTKIDHPFIVQLKYSFQTKYRLYLVLDFINGGHLFFQLYHQGLFRSNSMCGTTEYMAPEIVRGKGHDKAADWWSVGILLYEMLTGKPPFMGSKGKIQQKIVKDKIKLPQFLSTEAHALLKGLLQKEPERRLGSGPRGAGEIKEHKWFKGINWKKLEAREVKPSFKPEVSGRQCIANFDKCWTDMSVLDSPANSPRSDPKANPFTNFAYARPPRSILSQAT